MKLTLMPQNIFSFRISMLFAKFEAARSSGEMLPTAITTFDPAYDGKTTACGHKAITIVFCDTSVLIFTQPLVAYT